MAQQQSELDKIFGTAPGGATAPLPAGPGKVPGTPAPDELDKVFSLEAPASSTGPVSTLPGVYTPPTAPSILDQIGGHGLRPNATPANTLIIPPKLPAPSNVMLPSAAPPKPAPMAPPIAPGVPRISGELPPQSIEAERGFSNQDLSKVIAPLNTELPMPPLGPRLLTFVNGVPPAQQEAIKASGFGGVENPTDTGMAEVVHGLASPINAALAAATGPAGPVLHTLITAGFTIPQISSAMQLHRQMDDLTHKADLAQASGNPTEAGALRQQVAKLNGQLVATVGMAALGAIGTLTSLNKLASAPKATPEGAAAAGVQPDPGVMGEINRRGFKPASAFAPEDMEHVPNTETPIPNLRGYNSNLPGYNKGPANGSPKFDGGLSMGTPIPEGQSPADVMNPGQGAQTAAELTHQADLAQAAGNVTEASALRQRVAQMQPQAAPPPPPVEPEPQPQAPPEAPPAAAPQPAQASAQTGGAPSPDELNNIFGADATKTERVDRIRGQINVPLNDAGRQQVAKLGQDIAAKGGLDEIRTADLSRNLDTAAAIATQTGAPIKSMPELRDMHYGVLGGQPSSEAIPSINAHIESMPKQAIPGGESFDAYINRIIPQVGQAVEEAKTTGKSIGMVINRRTIKTIEATLATDGKFNTDVDPKVATSYTKGQTEPGTIYQIVDAGAGKYKLAEVNPTSPEPLAKGSVYLIRHGETDWNGTTAEPVGGMKTQQSRAATKTKSTNFAPGTTTLTDASNQTGAGFIDDSGQYHHVNQLENKFTTHKDVLEKSGMMTERSVGESDLTGALRNNKLIRIRDTPFQRGTRDTRPVPGTLGIELAHKPSAAAQAALENLIRQRGGPEATPTQIGIDSYFKTKSGRPDMSNKYYVGSEAAVEGLHKQVEEMSGLPRVQKSAASEAPNPKSVEPAAASLERMRYSKTPGGAMITMPPDVWNDLANHISGDTFKDAHAVTYSDISAHNIEWFRKQSHNGLFPEWTELADKLAPHAGANDSIVIAQVGGGRSISRTKEDLRHERLHQRLNAAGIDFYKVYFGNGLSGGFPDTHGAIDALARYGYNILDHETVIQEILAHIVSGPEGIQVLGLTPETAAELAWDIKNKFEAQIGVEATRNIFKNTAPGEVRNRVLDESNKTQSTVQSITKPGNIGSTNERGVERGNDANPQQPTGGSFHGAASSLRNIYETAGRPGYLTAARAIREAAPGAPPGIAGPIYKILTGVTPRDAMRGLHPETATAVEKFLSDPRAHIKLSGVFREGGKMPAQQARVPKAFLPGGETGAIRFGGVRDRNPLPTDPKYTRIHDAQEAALATDPRSQTLMERLQAAPTDAVRALTDRWIDVRKLPEDARARGVTVHPNQDPYMAVKREFGGGMGEGEATVDESRKVILDARQHEVLPEVRGYLNIKGNLRAIQVVEEKILTAARETVRLRALAAGTPAGSGQKFKTLREAKKQEKIWKDLFDRLAANKVASAGYSKTELQTALKNLQTATDPAKWTHVERLAKQEFALNRQTLDDYHNEGLISDDLYKTLTARGDEYVNMSRIIDMVDADHKFSGGSGLTLREQHGIRSLTGSDRINEDPFIADIEGRQLMYRDIAKNRGGRAIINFAWVDTIKPNTSGHTTEFERFVRELKSGDRPDVMAGEGEITIYRNGKPVSYAVPAVIADAVKLANEDEMKIWGGGVLSAVQHVFQAMTTTFNLGWQIPNLFRDHGDTRAFIGKMYNSKDSAKYMTYVVKSLGDIITRDAAYLDHLRSGAAMASIQRLNTPHTFLDPQRAYMRPVIDRFKHPFHTIEEFVGAMDQVQKVAARQYLMGKGMSDAEATNLAREYAGNPDTLNSGYLGARLGKLFTFINSQNKGLYREYQFAKTNPRKFAMVALKAAIVAGLILRWNSQFASPENDGTLEWDHIPQSDKENYYNIILPWTYQTSAGALRHVVAKIPGPHFTFQLLDNTAMHLWETVMTPQKDYIQTALEAASNAFPGSVHLERGDLAGSAARGVVSSLNPAMQEPIEQLANRETFTNVPIVPGNMEGPAVRFGKQSAGEGLDPRYQYDENTSPSIVKLSHALEAVTTVAVSPKRLEHVVRGGLSGVGDMLLSALDSQQKNPTRTAPTEGPEKISKLPIFGQVARRFLGSTTDQRDVDLERNFYDMLGKSSGAATTLDKGFESATKRQDTITSFAGDPQKVILAEAHTMLTEYSKTLGQLRNLSHAIAKSTKLSEVDSSVKPEQDQPLTIQLKKQLIRTSHVQVMTLLKQVDEFRKSLETVHTMSRDDVQKRLEAILNRDKNLNPEPTQQEPTNEPTETQP